MMGLSSDGKLLAVSHTQRHTSQTNGMQRIFQRAKVQKANANSMKMNLVR